MTNLAQNKKALFDYEILEKMDAGIILTGAEVKACRENKINLKGSYITCLGNRVFAEKIHISPYQKSNQKDYDPIKRRELLLTKKEIKKICEELNEKGISCVPLEMFLKNKFIKIKIALCRGKKKYDKREDLKKKSIDRELRKRMKI
ncbi:SsrA-binding protein [Candidatus Peregrinibacteria bacterium RIFOXYC2_FULL_33_13]|nr:MAG: SsrA-binding protein [Candidatus Peregrinibacteria bacterium GW2011_GWA2_33_10]KKP40932.1 MAG: ssrA RNA (tmRNA)-binding protein, SsrA-binding protein [Candidatus Peregrinibacteria bacterium GW2011_GWC2_33_13]OGJ46626.1 MAG: SsrA-binding protein [Candidatus Peregrinibacteria bacterium RIFOXYA2_FULL_33_7]OGJ52369.1 MAG: SsrA-binding protein [Candidatus Peregrinibacteria bacterium RIFOXYC2_FULL_33_13]